MAEQLGQAVLTLTVNDDDLKLKLNAARTLLGSLDTRPIKLQVDAGGTTSVLATTQKGLRNISTEADKAAVKTRTLNQVINSFPSGTYSGLSAQIRKLTQESGNLQITSEQYLKTLTRIKELEGLRSIRAGRQGVIADANAFGSGGALSKLDPAQLPQLPKTIAGDLQLVKELTQRLRNLDQGTTAYELTLRRLDATQQRVSDSAARVLRSREQPTPGFGEFSASISQRDPVKGSIDRNQQKVSAEAEREGKAREKALSASKDLLALDIQRAAALRQVSQRLQEQALLLDAQKSSGTGFGAFSASVGQRDPVESSINRNQEKVNAEAQREGKERENNLRITNAQLDADLQRAVVLRDIANRIKASASDAAGGFGSASATNFGTSDPVQKSIRRNQEKVGNTSSRSQNQLDTLLDDLAVVRETRVANEKKKLADEIRSAERTDRRQQKISDRQEYLSTGGLDRSVAGGQSFRAPDPGAIKAEEALQRARANTAAQTLRTTTTENKQRASQAAARRKDINKRVSGAIGSGLIGGGFPLLFGQGAGAAVGGAVGGVGGGAIGGQFGFALSVIGTAVGAAFDAALEKGKTLAAGLDDPIGQFDKLREAALFSSKGIEKTVGALIAAGRGEEAKIIAQDDLNKQFGGAENAKEFAAATDELNRAWAQASIALADFVAGPMANFLRGIAAGLGGTPEQRATISSNKAAQEIIDSSPEKRKEFRDLAAQRNVKLDPKTLRVATDGRGKDLAARNELVKEFLKLNNQIPAAQREQDALEKKLTEAAQRRLDIEQDNLNLIKAQTLGDRTTVLDVRESLVRKERTRALNSLPDGDTTVQRETINVEADKELVKIGTERLKLQRELTKALLDEAAARAAIVRQIQTAEAGREAALARADFGASPGSSALGARAGAAEGAAFKLQNQEGVQAAIAAQRQLQSNLQFEVDPGKQAELVSKIKTAAEQTRLAYVQAGTALAEKVGQAAASLQGAQASLRGTLESNSNLIPRADRAILKDAAKADIDRGRRTGILRENLRTPGSTRRQFEIANFVRQVEQQRAQIASQQALVEALNNNTLSERSVQITVTSDGQGGYNVNQSDRQAATL